MGGVYGDMLSSFPELLDTYIVFQMEAQPGGGYGRRKHKKEVDGILRRVPGGKMGIMGDNRMPNEIATFWIFEDDEDKVKEGSYLEDDGELFILTKSNTYTREGGFVEFTAALVPGPNDMQKEDRSVIQRALNDFE